MKIIIQFTLPAAVLCLLALGCCGAGSKAVTLTYENPLWDGCLADPFVFKVDETYYACGTGSTGDGR